MSKWGKKYPSPISRTKTVTIQQWMCDHIAINRARWKNKPFPEPGYSNESPSYYRNTMIWINRLLDKYPTPDENPYIENIVIDYWKESKPISIITNRNFNDTCKAIDFRLNRINEQQKKLREAQAEQSDEKPVKFKEHIVTKKKNPILLIEEIEKDGKKV
jgi:hypothetical protein